MLLAKVSHMAKIDVSGMGTRKPPANREAELIWRESAEGNKATKVS